MAREHLDYKYEEFCKDCLRITVWARRLFTNLKTPQRPLGQLAPALVRAILLAVSKSRTGAPTREVSLPVNTSVPSVPKPHALAEYNIATASKQNKNLLLLQIKQGFFYFGRGRG